MFVMNEKNILFKYYFEARYATNLIFQQSNRPCENVRENRLYYSGKHHLYGLKTEISVPPNGIAIGSSNTYPGLMADITIFEKQLAIHRLWTEKNDEENVDLENCGELHLKYTNNWAILLDKGCFEIQATIRAVISEKKTWNANLTNSDKSKNHYISHDRVIVETHFGRMCSFGLFAQKWRSDESNYETFFQAGMALTNLSTSFNGLRAHDQKLSTLVHNRAATNGEQMKRKRATAQAQYRTN